MKMIKNISIILTLCMTAMAINVFAYDKTPASFDFNIQNLTQDSVVTIKLTTPNPNWSGMIDETSEDIRHRPKIVQTIQLSPGDQPYTEQGVQLIPCDTQFEIFVKSKNAHRKKLLSGSLMFKGISGSGPKVGHFHGKSYTYDLNYDKSTHRGNFGFILEDKAEL